jgi:F-type H+-transporting ATPase subunit alpha
MTSDAAYRFDQAFNAALNIPIPRLETREIGRIVSLSGGVAKIEGFKSMRPGELIDLPGNGVALAANLSEKAVGAIVLNEMTNLSVGMTAQRTGRPADTPVGEALLGRVVTPLGRPLDGDGPIETSTRLRVERPAPPILDRAPVRRPLLTGVKAIDATLPIGRGQRELILGDRQTGKTSLAVDAMLNQGDDVVCIYCAIGQRQSAVGRVIQKIKEAGAMHRCIFVVASGEDVPGLRYLAPFAATSMAEYFMEAGRDALIVYDDLTKHARSYRELSLLLRRPPGREAYPGDIFYLHARLLERATQLKDVHGGGSLTALPIIETQAQNISAYIPTNLISITDGQIFLSAHLFEKGILPAIDIRNSVSRVGAKAQPAAFFSVTAEIKPLYAQFEELETFARFGTRLDEATQKRLVRGRRVREVLKQDECMPIQVREQIAILLAATSGLLDPVPLTRIADAEAFIAQFVLKSTDQIWTDFDQLEALPIAEKGKMIADLKTAMVQFSENSFEWGAGDGNP